MFGCYGLSDLVEGREGNLLLLIRGAILQRYQISVDPIHLVQLVKIQWMMFCITSLQAPSRIEKPFCDSDNA